MSFLLSHFPGQRAAGPELVLSLPCSILFLLLVFQGIGAAITWREFNTSLPEPRGIAVGALNPDVGPVPGTSGTLEGCQPLQLCHLCCHKQGDKLRKPLSKAEKGFGTWGCLFFLAVPSDPCWLCCWMRERDPAAQSPSPLCCSFLFNVLDPSHCSGKGHCHQGPCVAYSRRKYFNIQTLLELTTRWSSLGE